jgi:hypothetical protein
MQMVQFWTGVAMVALLGIYDSVMNMLLSSLI